MTGRYWQQKGWHGALHNGPYSLKQASQRKHMSDTKIPENDSTKTRGHLDQVVIVLLHSSDLPLLNLLLKPIFRQLPQGRGLLLPRWPQRPVHRSVADEHMGV